MRELYTEKEVMSVVELEPQQRTIKINMNPYARGGGVRTFYLGFPYMQFYWLNRQLHLTFSKKPIQDLEKDNFTFPFIPNIWLADFRVCLRIPSYRGFSRNVSENVKKAIGIFWQQRFYFDPRWYGLWTMPGIFEKNETMSTRREDVLQQVTNTLEAWDRKDPEYIMDLDWVHSIKNPVSHLKNRKSLCALSNMRFTNRKSMHR